MKPKESLRAVPAEFLKETHVQALLATPRNLPPRSLKYGEVDKFNLLNVEDTYEPVVGVLFEGCEAMEKLLVSKRQRRHDTAILPEVSFDNVRKFSITRTNKPDNTKEYHFQRVGDPSSGFLISRIAEGNILLRYPEQGDTPTTDDEEYHGLISQATNFLQEYAKKCGMTPDILAPKAHVNPTIKNNKLEREKRIRKPHPAAKQLAKVIIATSVFAGLPSYCVDESLNTGYGWQATSVHRDQEHVVAAQRALKAQKVELTTMEASLGKLCATAIGPYSPDGTLADVSITEAATQLIEEDRCDQSGENTQLVVQDYRGQVNNIDNADYILGQKANKVSVQIKRANNIDFWMTVSGLLVGGVSDGIIYGAYDIIYAGEKRRERRKMEDLDRRRRLG